MYCHRLNYCQEGLESSSDFLCMDASMEGVWDEENQIYFQGATSQEMG